MTSARIEASALRRFCEALLGAVGTPVDIAAVVARILVASDLAGHVSHGVHQLPRLLREVDDGRLDPSARPSVVGEHASAVTVNAHHGWGHHSAYWATDLAVTRSQDTGVCGVSLAGCGHIGRLGEYAEQACRAGRIAWLTYGGGGRGRGVAAPYGGAASALETNPISFGIPTDDGRHLIADLATTMVAGGKIEIAQLRGARLPPGCILDKAGNPTVDPDDFCDGGRHLVFGGYKGYALSLLTCLLGGLEPAVADDRQMAGTFVLVIDPTAFGDLDTYRSSAAALLSGMRHSEPAPGHDAVFVPGDLERRTSERQAREGIELPASVVHRLDEHASRVGVARVSEVGPQ